LLAPDDTGFTDRRQRRFFALLDDTLVVDVAYTHSAPALESAITDVDPGIAYDDFRHRLSHRGLVTEAMQTALKNVGGVSNDFRVL